MTEAVWFPEKSFLEKTRIYQWMKQLGYDRYNDFYQASIKDISWFWREAERVLDIEWFTPYKNTIENATDFQWPRWYVDGKLNVAYNAVHKWEKRKDTKNTPAIRWEGEDGKVVTYHFSDLKKAVDQAASGFIQMGIKKGDVITFYMPMIPETVIAMMAASKIGAIFSPVFSGYGANAVASRINAAESNVLITADGFKRKGRDILMKEEADRAASKSKTVEKVIVVRRLGREVNWNKDRDIDWIEIIKADSLPSTMQKMDSSDPMMLIYTSGTTGRPKGTVHTHSGFPIKAAFDAGIGMDVKKGDTLFWYTDMGWMMGPFLVYGALLNGATLVMYEGAPDFPQPDRLWNVVDHHKVTHLGISPTLIRTLMTHGEKWVNQHSLSTLRVIASTGEPWNPDPWKWLFKTAGKGKTPIFNYSGGTEIAGGILGNVLVKPIGPITFNAALPGMAADVYNEKGTPVQDEVGELVLTKPWVGMTNGFWKEPERYEKTYWSRWKNTWVHGDWAMKDQGGYWVITGRSDDIINIAGKRLGPAEMESVLVEHPAVREAATIGVPHELKGEEAISFVVLREDSEPSESLEKELVDQCTKKLGKSLRPSRVFAVHDLPKTRNAKVMRRAIKAAYLNKDAGDLSSLENPEAVEAIRKIGSKNK